MDRYSDIFEDHLNIARELFIKENGREPTQSELLDKLQEINEYYFG